MPNWQEAPLVEDEKKPKRSWQSAPLAEEPKPQERIAEQGARGVGTGLLKSYQDALLLPIQTLGKLRDPTGGEGPEVLGEVANRAREQVLREPDPQTTGEEYA